MTSPYTPIESAGFSPRTVNALINGEIGSIEQLMEKRSQVANLRGIGPHSIEEINKFLSSFEKRTLADDLTLSEKAQVVAALATSSLNEPTKLKALSYFIK